MRLIFLPFLVHKCIAGQLNLLEIFALANVSKRCKVIFYSCLIPRQFKIVYNTNGLIKIQRTYSDESDNENLKVWFIDQSKQLFVYNYQLWTVFNNSSVAVKIGKYSTSETLIKTYWPDSKQVQINMLEFIVGVFPKSVLTLQFQTGNMDVVLNTLQVTKTLNISVQFVLFRPIEEKREDAHDEFVKLLFDESKEAKKLRIECKISRSFDYACPTSFNFESISLAHAEWVTKDHVLNLFLNCGKVLLFEKQFCDQELSEIFKAWRNHSKTEVLFFGGLEDGDFYRTSLLTDIVKRFPGAVSVRKACVISNNISKVFQFKERRAYVIKAINGTQALVCKNFNDAMLTVHFRIGEDVERMNVDSTEVEEADVEDEEIGEDDGGQDEDEHNDN